MESPSKTFLKITSMNSWAMTSGSTISKFDERGVFKKHDVVIVFSPTKLRLRGSYRLEEDSIRVPRGNRFPRNVLDGSPSVFRQS